jgi:AcrR family transcriptional regulator
MLVSRWLDARRRPKIHLMSAHGDKPEPLAGEDSFLAAASRLFLDQGPDASVDDICRRAGMSKGGLYHHFPSKRDLLLRALARAEVSRRMPLESLLRLLPAARRDPDVARLISRSHGPLRVGAGPLLAEAEAYGRALSDLLGLAGPDVEKPLSAS